MTTIHDAAHDGEFRVPTLRNVRRTPPYGHNGYFANVSFAVDFITSRELGSPDAPTCTRAEPRALCAWPPPEVPTTIDDRLGNGPLSRDELADVVAFLGSLDDAPAH
jgi:cytochrome c peroxidase